MKSVGNWFEERYDDWKTGADIIKNDEAFTVIKEDVVPIVKDSVISGAKSFSLWAYAGVDKIGAAALTGLDKAKSLFGIIQKKDTGLNRISIHSENVVNVGLGHYDKIKGNFTDEQKQEYINHCENTYENLVCYMVNGCPDTEVDISGVEWEDMDDELKTYINNRQYVWDKDAFKDIYVGTALDAWKDGACIVYPYT